MLHDEHLIWQEFQNSAYAKLFNNGGLNNIQSYVRMQNSLFSGPTNNWNWSLEKKMHWNEGLFLQKEEEKKSFFSFLFGLCKGQLISKTIYGILDYPKKWTKNIWLDIS